MALPAAEEADGIRCQQPPDHVIGRPPPQHFSGEVSLIRETADLTRVWQGSPVE
jgi:hypothetical protein